MGPKAIAIPRGIPIGNAMIIVFSSDDDDIFKLAKIDESDMPKHFVVYTYEIVHGGSRHDNMSKVNVTILLMIPIT